MEENMTGHAQEQTATSRVLEQYDATGLIGLRTIVHGAAIQSIDNNGDETIELPKMGQLLATAALARCLLPIKLRGTEIRAIRRIMKMTLSDLAKKLDERTAAETISRWEAEAQPMGGYAEKLLRLVVCEQLCGDAPGMSYQAAMIANLKVVDPWRRDAGYEVPHISLSLVRMKEQSGSVIEAWDAVKMAA
jgi:DNA-binding transcriptional regulator YiaG